jgi:cytochrome P450
MTKRPHTLLESLALFHDDPDAYYASIRNLAGCAHAYRDESLNAWVITGYKECVSLLRSGKLLRSRLRLQPIPDAGDLVECALHILHSQTMFNDGANAANRRTYWGRFVARTEGDRVVPLRNIVESSLREVETGSEIDLYRQLLQPYVSRAISSRLGITECERQELSAAVSSYVKLLDGKISDERQLKLALFAVVFLYSRLATKCAHLQVGSSSTHEVVSDYVLNLVAGHDSAAYLLASVLIHAGGPVGLLAEAGDDQQRLARLVHEAARLDSPVQLIGRRASEALAINGKKIPAGQQVLLHIGAANRDCRVFTHAGAFSALRTGPPQLAFGYGDSKCTGVAFAFNEVVTFLAVLARRGDRLLVDAHNVAWEHGLAARGLSRLPGRLLPVPIHA